MMRPILHDLIRLNKICYWWINLNLVFQYPISIGCINLTTFQFPIELQLSCVLFSHNNKKRINLMKIKSVPQLRFQLILMVIEHQNDPSCAFELPAKWRYYSANNKWHPTVLSWCCEKYVSILIDVHWSQCIVILHAKCSCNWNHTVGMKVS